MDAILYSKLFELQQLVSRKVELGIEVASIEARERTYQLELDLRRSIHSIGGERARFGEAGMLQLMRERRESDEATKDKYRELRSQIRNLAEEISQLISAAV